jgi:hypothetical protein
VHPVYNIHTLKPHEHKREIARRLRQKKRKEEKDAQRGNDEGHLTNDH